MSDNSQQEINRKAMQEAAAKAQQQQSGNNNVPGQPIQQTNANGQVIGVGNNTSNPSPTIKVGASQEGGLENAGTPGVTGGNKQEQNKPASTNPGDLGNAQNSNGLDINQFVQSSTGAIKSADEKTQAKKERQTYLNKVFNALNNIETIVYTDEETDEVLGSKIRYRQDSEGKTIYDYMQDEIVQEHLGFVIPEGDGQENGGLIEKQISFYWKKPTY